MRSCADTSHRGGRIQPEHRSDPVPPIPGRRCLRILRQRAAQGKPPIFYCDRVYGQLQTGNMNIGYLLQLLPRLTGQTVEIYFHPGAPHARPLPCTEQCGDGVRDVELRALLDRGVHAEIQQRHLPLGRYEDAERAIRTRIASPTG